MKDPEDTEEEDHQLAQCLSFIEKVHELQYAKDNSPSFPSGNSTTSMTVLDHAVNIKQAILKGYAFAFSGVFPKNSPIHKHPMYSMCLSLGAEVCMDQEITQHSRVTHILTVETHMNSTKVQTGVKNRDDVWVVHKDWLR